jgi:hypothetical protein
MNYQRRYGLDTIEQMINRYAPPTENITSAYVLHIAEAVGVAPDEPVNVAQFDIAAPMITAMIWHENGKQPYSDQLIAEGLALAGIERG